MSNVNLSGNLEEGTFPRLVGVIAREHCTGVVDINEAIGSHTAFFLKGAPQGARLSRLSNPLGRILVKLGTVSEAVLDEALTVHNRTDKLLGQVLLEMGAVTKEDLQRAICEQSRANFLSLFAQTTGDYELREGLVHLTGFSAAPMTPLVAIYEGMREHAPSIVLERWLGHLAFATVQLTREVADVDSLPGAEQETVAALRTPLQSGDVARSSTLGPRALGALLFALNEVGVLLVAPLRR